MLERPPWLDRSNYPLDWNGPEGRACTELADTDLARPVFALFARAAQVHGERIALDDGSARLTYGEALAAANALAQRLAHETSPGELVGILLPSSCDFMLAMLACLAAGRLFVPLDSHYPAAWLGGVMRDCGLAAAIGRFDDPEVAAQVPEAVRRIDLGDATRVPPAPLIPVGPDAPAFVLFTSGSTGRPKGIVNSQRALLRRVAQYVEAAHVDASDRFLPLSSECTIAGLRERFTALLSGAGLHLIDVQRSGARQILDRLAQARITMIYAVPALLRTLMQLDAGAAPDSLRNVRVGGDAVLWSDVDALRGWLPQECRIQLGYSSTEAPIMQWFVPRDFPREGPRVPLGFPLAGNALAIVGETGEAATPGEPGELVLRSPYVALGRWDNGRVDASGFPPDPKDPSCRIHATGDLVRLRPDGLIDLVGRKDRQIKIRGIRVEPGELEAAIRRHAGVRDAAVYPRRVGRHWQLIAYVVGAADVARLKTELRETLPAALQPRQIHKVDAVPRLASGKLDMAGLAALDEAASRGEGERPVSAPPQGRTEEAVAAIWRRVLEREQVGRDDDFFDLGGDSLSTLNLMFAIEQEFGDVLPVTAIYAAPTVARLAAAIEGHQATEFSLLVPIKAGAGAPLFIVHGVGGNVMELFAAGRRIDCDGPVIAIQARGLDGKETPRESIPAMAQDYIVAVRRAFPSGPIHLAGYSSGGLIAFEMAQRLMAQGTPVASLTLIDAQTNARQWPLAIWLGLLTDRAKHHVRALARMTPGEGLRHAAAIFRSLVRRILWRAGAGTEEPLRETRLPPALQAVAEATLKAVVAYAPRYYAGPVLLIVPERTDPMRPDPARLWRRLCAAMTVRVVPGHHLSMVQGANAAHLAEVLSDVLAG